MVHPTVTLVANFSVPSSVCLTRPTLTRTLTITIFARHKIKTQCRRPYAHANAAFTTLTLSYIPSFRNLSHLMLMLSYAVTIITRTGSYDDSYFTNYNTTYYYSKGPYLQLE